MTVDYLNPPDELLYQPIEPWHPRVGDRVRVVLNLECRAESDVWRDGRFEFEHVGHEQTEHGAVGVVTEDCGDEYTHRYMVLFNHPIPWRNGTCKDAAYAASELELI
jgi:hypothetical protein